MDFTIYTDLGWQSQLMTCKTTMRNLTCITEFSLSICQYLVLQICTIKSLRLPRNFSLPDQHISPIKKLSKIVSAVVKKNLLHSIQTKKKIRIAKNTTYQNVRDT